MLTGPLLVLNLYLSPGGTAERGFEVRDGFLRWVARRHDLLVPSLVADRRVEGAADTVVAAETSVETTPPIAAEEARLACPVCGVVLRLDEAANHDHLQLAGAEQKT